MHAVDKFRRINIKYVVSSGVLFVFLSISCAVYFLLKDIEKEKFEIKENGSSIVDNFNVEIEVFYHSLNAMRFMTDQYFSNITNTNVNTVESLRYTEDKSNFYLDVPKGYEENQIGNITGYGSIPSEGSQAAKEMSMSLLLTPLFQLIMNCDPETPWVYYTSFEKFMYLFPRVGIDHFLFTQKVYDTPFIQGALPKHNPNRKIFWTPVYNDEAGKGLMVTVSNPVYEKDILRGVLSIDISIDKLQKYLLYREIKYSSIYLISNTGELLTGTDSNFEKIDLERIKVAEPSRIGFDLYTRFLLKENNWSIVIKTDLYDLSTASLWKVLPIIFILFLFVICILLVVILLNSIKHISKLSTEDFLTSTYNRRMFDHCARSEICVLNRRSNYLAIILIDVDDFKKINDEKGHTGGDSVLKQIAVTLHSCLRRDSDKLFRVGGEEFAILTYVDDQKQLEALMGILLKSIDDLNIVQNSSRYGHVTISLGGVVIKSEDSITQDEALRRADIELYKVKNNGKHGWSIYNS
ncbi:MAG: diguanylate cyclase [Solidesulfovibrio sp.]|uniref:sensor domain-containing diguanylate cyclase n=1 Tax=Solidesulfovibrio sp. TaxID=2910990 RepID=UPI003159312B